MRATLSLATTAAHALRRVLANNAGLAAGAASAGDPGPLLEVGAHGCARATAPRR
jgi:hypothetical protein